MRKQWQWPSFCCDLLIFSLALFIYQAGVGHLRSCLAVVCRRKCFATDAVMRNPFEALVSTAACGMGPLCFQSVSYDTARSRCKTPDVLSVHSLAYKVIE